jgi:hypothetical protein
VNTTSVRPLRALGAATAALLLTGLLAACGGDAAGPDPVVPATLNAQSDAASPSASASPSDDASSSAEVTGEGENAFVTAIGGRAADDSKKEFWSLSVDGEPAQVGAGTLETEDGQEITWTIETY